MKTFKYLFFLAFMMTAGSMIVNAQVKDEAELKSMLDSKTFVFKARTVSPQGAPSRQLTSDYGVNFTGDKVIADLPYFGRAYSGSAYGGEGGIKFTSSDFKYTMKENKKRWSITIVPNDDNSVQRMNLDVSKGGYATLIVTSRNRSNISFYGVIEKE